VGRRLGGAGLRRKGGTYLDFCFAPDEMMISGSGEVCVLFITKGGGLAGLPFQ
jgi:hypothetical protein